MFWTGPFCDIGADFRHELKSATSIYSGDSGKIDTKDLFQIAREIKGIFILLGLSF